MSMTNAKKKKSKADESPQNNEDELQNIIDRMISEEYIMKVTGEMNLAKIEHLQLVVDTSVQSVFGLNEMLPNLRTLTLDKSVIGSIRDLGSGLRNIVKLSLSTCGLYDLDGIGVLTGLQEINLSNNNISDVAPLAIHENLQVLNVSGNRIMDISIGDALSSCPNLKHLVLQKNVIATATNYRDIVASLIPSLERLDYMPVNHNASRAKVTLAMIDEAVKEIKANSQGFNTKNNVLHNDNIDVNKPASPSRSSSNSTNSSISNWNGIVPNTGSELTHGSSVVLAGSMASAMRQRRNNTNSNRNSRDESALDALDAPHSYEPGSHFVKEGDITALTLGTLKCNIDDIEYSDLPEGQLSSARSGGRPLQSPRIESARGSQNGKFFQNFDDVSTPSKSRPRTASSSKGAFDTQPEPRQMNSSRPQSAVSTAGLARVGSSGKLLTNFSIPFKVGSSVEGEKVLSRPPSGSSAGSNRHSRQSSADFEVEEVDTAPSFGKSKSIVHLDIVKRHPTKNSPAVSDIDGLECIPMDEGVGEDSGSDNENIAVTHAARHRLMSASASNATVTASRQRNQVLSQLFSSDRSTPTTERGTPEINRKPPIKPSASTTSSKAGKSLGFNLAGSLAAIDQWVHDMNSEDESEVKSKNKTNGIVAMNKDSSSDDGIEPNMQRILSRDVIINMCAGSTSKIPNSSRKVESDSDDSDSEDIGRRRAPAKMFLGDSHVPLNANTSSLMNKANNTMNIARSEPPRVVSNGVRKSNDSNIIITKEPVKAVKLKSPLPDFGKSTSSKVESMEVNNSTPKKNGKYDVVVEETSPPRYTAEPVLKANKLGCGAGVSMSDGDIVALLRRPPKETLELRTKGNFAAYFRGISASRMKSLLTQAYSDAESIEDRDAKVQRRMELLVDVEP